MVGQVVSDELKKLSTQIQPNYLRLKNITTQHNPTHQPRKVSWFLWVGGLNAHSKVDGSILVVNREHVFFKGYAEVSNIVVANNTN